MRSSSLIRDGNTSPMRTQSHEMLSGPLSSRTHRDVWGTLIWLIASYLVILSKCSFWSFYFFLSTFFILFWLLKVNSRILFLFIKMVCLFLCCSNNYALLCKTENKHSLRKCILTVTSNSFDHHVVCNLINLLSGTKVPFTLVCFHF